MNDRIDDMDLSNWITQLRKGVLELCIVNILSKGELYGYDLVKRLASIKGLVITEGTVYPLLSRLRTAGLLESRLVESQSGPVRKYYALTPAGKRAMKLMRSYWHDMSEGVEELNEEGES